jgi:hypothetical protein
MEEERIRQYKSGTAVEIKTDGCGGQEEKMNRNELTKKVGEQERREGEEEMEETR